MKTYRDYFGVKLRNQDKQFASYVCCKTYVENLRDWRNGKRKSMPFTIPMVWSEGKDHITDCYFCINLKGINHKNKHHVEYLDVPSVIRSIPHDPDLPVPQPDGNMKCRSDSIVTWLLLMGMTHTSQKKTTTSTLDTSRTQRADTRPFKGVCLATWFMSKREKSIGTKNNVLLVSRLREN